MQGDRAERGKAQTAGFERLYGKSKDLFLEPEKRFLIFYSFGSNIKFSWFESEEEVREFVKENKAKYRAYFSYDGGIEIKSWRELII